MKVMTPQCKLCLRAARALTCGARCPRSGLHFLLGPPRSYLLPCVQPKASHPSMCVARKRQARRPHQEHRTTPSMPCSLRRLVPGHAKTFASPNPQAFRAAASPRHTMRCTVYGTATHLQRVYEPVPGHHRHPRHRLLHTVAGQRAEQESARGYPVATRTEIEAQDGTCMQAEC